jgi:thioesterase domain-containing protein
VDTLEPSNMRKPITLLDRLLNTHRIKPHRFVRFPQLIWKYQMRPWIRKRMGVQEITPPRTLLEQASDAVDTAYRRAQFAYQTPPLETDVVVIRALDAHMSFLRTGPTLGWNAFVKGKIQVFDVEADHDRVFEEPSLSKVIAAFEQVLAEAR